MIKGVNIWCFPAGTPIPKVLEQARAAGFASVEVALGPNEQLNADTSDAKLRSLRRQADDLGIEISSVVSQSGWRWPLLTRNSAELAEAKRLTRESLRIARKLGAGTLLVVPGVVSPDMPYDEAYTRCLEVLIELSSDAAKAGVSLGVENVGNKFLLSPLEMAALIDQVDSPFVGVFFDTGNVLPTGYPEQWIRILGHRLKYIHMKDSRAGRDCGLLDGDVNWPAVMRALRGAGYNGHLTAEVGPVNAAFPEFLLQKTSLALDKMLTL